MSTIIFSNGVKFPTLETPVLGEKIIDGVLRNILVFKVNGGIMKDITGYDRLFSEENCKSIFIADENGEEYRYNGYTIMDSMVRKKKKTISKQSGEEIVTYDLEIVMAQRTILEAKVDSLLREVFENKLAICELYEKISGLDTTNDSITKMYADLISERCKSISEVPDDISEKVIQFLKLMEVPEHYYKK